MYRYTVSAEFANRAMAAEWLQWLKGGHVQDVLQCGALSAEVVRLDDAVTAYEVDMCFPIGRPTSSTATTTPLASRQRVWNDSPTAVVSSTNDQPESSRRPFRRLDERRAPK